MVHGNLRQKIIRAMLCVTLFTTTGVPVFAAEPPHEDPEAAKLVFSGISLLRYYSDSLDFVLSKDPAEVEARLEKMPFANILQSLEESADSFATSGIGISYLVVEIDKDVTQFSKLVKQSRLKEAIKLAASLRRQGVGVIAATSSRSLKAQLRQANNIKATKAVIIGEDEVRGGTVILRDMASSEQKTVPVGELAEQLK